MKTISQETASVITLRDYSEVQRGGDEYICDDDKEGYM